MNVYVKLLSNVKSVLKVRDHRTSPTIENGRSVDLCKGEISSPTGNYSEDGCCPTFDCYKPCVDFLGVSHGSEYLNSYTYESGSSSEEPSNVTDYGDYYDYGNYSSEDYSYNYSS